MFRLCKPSAHCTHNRGMTVYYRGADMSLARPGRKQATATEDFDVRISHLCRSQWPRGLRRRSKVARLLRSWVRIQLGAWMSVVSVVCCQVEVSATD